MGAQVVPENASESLFSQFAKSGGDFKGGFTRYLAFANEARKATGSGAMARTAINSVQDQIAKKEGKINALGVSTRDGDGSQRDFIDVVMDTIVKTKGQGAAFNKIFDPSRSGKAFSTMLTAYNDGSKFGKDGAAGRVAMEKLLSGDSSLKYASVGEMNKDAASRLDSPAVKIAQSSEAIRQAFAGKLAPVLEEFAKRAPAIAEAIGKALDFIIKHPLATLGGVVATGALHGAAKPMAGALARLAGDVVGGIGTRIGGTAGALTAAAGGALGSVGSTPVYITGAAPGTFPGQPGNIPMPGVPGGAGAGAAGASPFLGGAIGSALGGAAIGAIVGAGIGLVINDSIEAEKKAGADGTAWLKSHRNSGRYGMQHDPDYLAKRYGPGATNPDAIDPIAAIAMEANNSPYLNPHDHINKVLNPKALASPYASADEFDFQQGGTATFRFDKNAKAIGAADNMPRAPGEAGYGVLAPTKGDWGDPNAKPEGGKSLDTTAAQKQITDLGTAIDAVTAKLKSLEANSSALKNAFGRL